MSVMASILWKLWHEQLVAHDKQALFLVLAGFLGAFAFIRLSARVSRSPRFTWWPGSVVSGSGVHLHHLVWGICVMLAAGTLGFAAINASPWREVFAALFGIGAGLTLDEFALWVYLDDVYWAREGRASIDAAVIAAVVMSLVFVGARPFDIETGTLADAIVSSMAALIVLWLVGACFAKQRFLHGTIGLFLWPIAAYGAFRIGKPGSPWARRRYGEHSPGKQTKAERRFRADRRTERVKERLRDWIGGAPSEVYERRAIER
jgi:hypothetical protein